MGKLLQSTFLIIAIIISVISCKSKNNSGSHVVKLDLKNLPDTIVYFEELGFNETRILDSTISRNGKVIFSKNLNKDYFYEIIVGDIIIPVIPDSDRIIITGNWKDINTLCVEGSQATESVITFERNLTEYNNCIAQETQAKLGMSKVGIEPELTKTNTDVRSLEDLKQFIRNYADTVKYLQAAVYAIRNLDPVREVSYFQSFTSSLKERFSDNILTDSFVNIINMNLKQIKGNMVKIGEVAPTITALDMNNKTYTVKFEKKYTLIDFWASWCPPCRSENPNLAGTYQKWKGKNIQFVSFSLDNNIAKWKSAIIEDKLQWINLVDTNEWNARIVKIYGFDRIPTNILVNPEGKIIAINLYGIELDDALTKFVK